MKKFLLTLSFLTFLVVGLLAQTTFTATLSGPANWSTATWVKTGDLTNATYPGETGYVGELPGDVHNVVILTSSGTARTLTLDMSLTSHIGTLTVSNAPGVVTLSFGATQRSLIVQGNLSGGGTISMVGAGLAHSLTLNGSTNAIGALTTTAASGSTINYLAAGDQGVMALTTYQNINFGGSGIKTIGNANLSAAGNVDISGCTLAFNSTTLRTTTINGNLSGTGTIDMSGGNLAHVLDLKGATNAIGALTTSATGLSVVSYTGTNQTVFGSPNYRSVTFTNNTKTLQGDLTNTGVFSLSAATVLSLNGKNLALNGTTTIGNAATSNITGDANSVVSVTSNATAALTFPLINGSIKSLTINKTGATNTVSTTGLLTTASTIDLLNGTLATGANNTTLGSDLNISATGAITASTGTITVPGNITGAGALTFSGAGTVKVAGDLSSYTGTFTKSTSTFEYNGGNQIVKDLNYNNLTISGTGSKTYTPTQSLGGNLIINSGTSLDYGANQSITGTVTLNGSFNFSNSVAQTFSFGSLSGSGVLNMTGVGLAHSLNLNGATNSFSGTLNTTDGSGSTITYLPNAAQTVFGSSNYQNLTIAGGNTKTLQGNTTVKGNLLVSAGTLSLGTVPTIFVVNGTSTITGGFDFSTTLKTVTFNGNLSGAGSVTMQGAGIAHVLNLYGATNAITTFNTTASSGSSVAYLAGGNQTVFASLNYQNVSLGGSGTKTLASGAIILGGNLDVSGASTTLAFTNVAAQTLIVTGNLSGAGLIDMSGGNLSHTLSLRGTNNGIGGLTTSATGNSIVSYDGAGSQQVFASLNYRTLRTSNAGVKTLVGTTVANYGVNIDNSSELKLGGQSLDVYGAIINIVTTTSALNIDANATLSIANGLYIRNSGRFICVGTSGNPAKIKRAGATGGYYIYSNSAVADFQANYYQIDNLIGSGISLSSTSTINSTNNFSNGVFSNCSGTAILTLSTTTDLSSLPPITNVVFNSGTTYNVSRTTGTGKITFEQSSGALAGENYDQDNANPGTLVDWTFPGNVFYSKGNLPVGLVTSWGSNPDGSGANPTSVTDGLSTFIIRDGNTMTLDNNGDLKALALQVGQGTSGGLIIGQNATVRTLTIQNDLTISNGASVTMGSGANHKVVMLSGNIVNNGSLDLYGTGASYANVQMYGTSQIKGTSKPKFANLYIEATGVTTLGVDIDVSQNIQFKAGSKFIDGGKNITVSGNWDNQSGVATNLTMSGTTTFAGLASTIGAGTTTTFYNLLSIAQNFFVSNATNVNGTFQASSSSSIIANSALVFNGNVVFDAGTVFSSTSTVTASLAGNQTLDLLGTVTFYDLILSAGGTKSINGDFIANRYVTINSGVTVTGAGTYTINNNFTIDGACNWSGKIIQKGGKIQTSSALNALTLGTAELDVQGTVVLGFVGPATSCAVTTNNNVTITSGSLEVAFKTTLIGQLTRTLKLNSVLYIRDSDNFPSGFGTYDLASNVNSRVIYDQNINQTIRGGITYNRLDVASSNPSTVASLKSVDGILDVNGYFGLGASTTLDLGALTHTFAGDMAVNASANLNGVNANINLDAPDANQTVTGGTITVKDLSIDQMGATASRTKDISAITNFTLLGNLNVANSSGSPSLLLTLNIGNLNINGPANNLALGAYTQLNTAHADFYTSVINNFSGTISLDLNSTVNYSLAGIQLVADGLTYGNLSLGGSGNKTARGALDINGNLSGGGVFIDAGFSHHLAGNWALATGSYGGVGATGTIVLDGVNQIIGGQTFNNLEVANSGLADVNNDLTLMGNLVVQPGGTIDFSVRNLGIKGDFSVLGSGTFTQTTGTTSFSGTVDQNITSNNNSSLGSFTVAKPLGAETTKVIVNSTLKIAGNTTVNIDGGVLDLTTQTVDFGGHVLINDNDFIGSSNFLAANATVRINGGVSQYFRTRSGYAIKVKNLYFSGSGNKVIGSIWNGRTPAAVGNDSIVVLGDFDIAGANINSSTGVLDAGPNIFLYGNWINTGTFSHPGPGNRTVFLKGGDQTITATDFYNLTVEGTGTKTLLGAININNTLTLTSANFDCNNYQILVGGSWVNSSPTGFFTPRTSTVVFTGSTGATITTGTTAGIAPGKGFYNLEIRKSTWANLAGDLEVQNNLLITTGSLTTGIYDLWIKGDFDNQGGTFSHNSNSSVITLNGSGGQKVFRPTYTGQSPVTILRGVVVNAPGTTYNVSNEFSIQQVDMNVTAGDFILNKNILNVYDANRRILINGGTLHVDSGSVVNFINAGGGINLNSGALNIIGNTSKTAKLSSSTGSFIVNQSGGVLSIGYYDILNGIFNITGGTLSATNNFSNGSFSGYNAGGATTAYINIDGINCGNIDMNNVVFNAGTTAAITPKYNVYRSTGTGVINFTDAVGTYAGQSYEKDNGVPGTLINWTYPAGFFWTAGGGADESWENPLNWASNVVPGPNDIAYINHKYVPASTPFKVHITSLTATAKRLMMDAQGGAGGIEVIIDAGSKLAIVEDVQILTNTTLTQSNSTSQLSLGTNWSNGGTFNHGNSTVTFNGTGGINNISSGGIGAGKAFNNIIINAPSTTYSLTNAAKFDGSVTVTNGIFDLYGGNNDISVGGDWYIDLINGGDFLCSTADVTFNGTNQNITNGIFYNLLTSNSGTKTLLSNLRVKNNVTIGASTTLNCGALDLYVGLNWLNLGTFTQTGIGTVTFDGTAAQSIDNGGTGTQFNHLAFSNGGVKTFFSNEQVNGNVTVNPGSGIVNLSTFTLNGAGSSNNLVSNGTIEIRGNNNFPTGFESINLASTSTVSYISNSNQSIYPTTYGNLSCSRITAGSPSTKTALGDITLLGNLTVNVESTLDMATNDASITLTGSMNVATGGFITWGSTSSTLTHVGGDITLDKDVTSYHHLVLGGTDDKSMGGNFTMTGNLTVKSGVDLFMGQEGNQSVTYTISGNGSNKITIESNGRILNTRPSSDGPAIPENFGSYNFDSNSNYRLWGANGVDQTLYTGSITQIVYGNLVNTNTKTITIAGNYNLRVDGNFDLTAGTSATLDDGGKDIEVRGLDIFLSGYTPSSTSRSFSLLGNANQYLRNYNIDNDIDFANVVFGGGGTKTLGDGNDNVNVTGNWTINSNVVVTSGRNITFTGSNWVNNGTFTHSGGTVFFNGLSNQSINSGTPSASNYFNALSFANASTKSFVTNGADINSTFTIVDGTVDLGNLMFHTIGGSIINTTGGTLLSGSANITFDGGNQNVQSPNFAVGNVTIAGTGTKRLFSNWTINGNLLINSGTILNTSDNGAPATYYNISIGGHWINNGTYTNNTSVVTFNGINSQTDILAGTGNFYDVVFGTNSSIYKLLSPTTRISRSMVLGANGELNLNENTLILGSNIASGKTFDVSGTLTVNKNSYLKFNNQTSKSVLTVKSGGLLRVVGQNSTTVATITREVAGVAGAETQITIESGGKLAAQYYLIEYLQDAGMDCQPGSILDATYNLSDGNWANIRNVAGAKYLRLESDYTGGDIQNCSFTFTATPTVGTNFNVERKLATTPITFGSVGGALGSYKFETDEEAMASATTGLLHWPAVTLTNWTGAVSTDWHDNGNWDNGVPTATIDAYVADKANDPIISSGNATCKMLQISDGTVTLSSGKNLTVSGDLTIGTTTLAGKLVNSSATSTIYVGGSWKRGTNGIFIHGNGTVWFNASAGSVSVDPGTQKFYNVSFNGANTIFNLIGAAVTFDGSVTINAGEVVPSSNNYNHVIKGDFYTKLGAVFTPTGGAVATGKITLSGANQAVTNGVFYNLDVLGTGTKTVNGVTTINGVTTVSSTLKAASGAPITWLGDITLAVGSTFDDGGETHTFKGSNWLGNGSYVGSGTVVFDRTGTQIINPGAFNSVLIKTVGILRVYGVGSIKSNIHILSGATVQIQNSATFNNISGTGTLTADAGASITLLESNFPTGFSSYLLDAGSTSTYLGATNQNVAGVSYGNLVLQSTNTKTLLGNTTVKGNLTFNTATLDVSTNNYSLDVAGQWYNGGIGTFVPRQGTVTFNGTVNQNINVGASNANDFYNLVIANSGSTGSNTVAVNWPTSNLRSISNNLTVSSGIYNANGRVQTIGGDFLVNGTGALTANNDFILSKASGTASLSTNGSTIRNLTFSGSATYTPIDNLTVLGNFTQNGGVFNGNGTYAYLGDNADVITINGTYKVGANGQMLIGGASGVTVGSSGRFELIGSAAGLALVTCNPVYTGNGRYTFTVNGTIAARYYGFEYMGSGGINLSSSSTIDATNNLSDGTFSNGVANQPLLQIQNSQTFIAPSYISNVTFPSNAGGTAKNVRKTNGAGTIEFYNATGIFAGPTYEDDPASLVNWTGPLKLTWNGSISTDWNTAANWTASFGPSFVPTGAEDVIIPSGPVNQPVLTTFGQKTANLTINNGAKITLNTPNDGGAIDLDINGDLNLIGNIIPQSSDDFINLTGSWAKTGTGAAVLGTVSFSGTGSSKTINNGSMGSFDNIKIGGSTLYQITVQTTINNDLVILSGASFGTGANQLIVKGNWSNSGTFIPATGTVRLKATSGSKTISNGSSVFNNLEINAPSATYQLNSNVTVYGNLDVTTGTLNLNNYTARVGDNSGTDFFNIYGQVVANGTSKINMVGTIGTPAKLIVYGGGSLSLVGTNSTSVATVYSSTGGRYDFSVESTGNLAAQYYSIANTTSAGLNVKSGAILSTTNNLSYGTFSNGLAGYSYLTLGNEMATDQTVTNLTFNTGALYNVSRTSGTTVFSFVDAGGVLGGYLYENDMGGTPDATSGLLRWQTLSLYTWLGLSNDWTVSSNWFNNVLPTSTSDVTINSGTPFAPIIKSGANVTVNSINVVSGATLTLANSAKLTVSNNLNVQGELIINNQPNAMASLITNGTVTGNVKVVNTLTKNRYWYMGVAVQNQTSGIFKAADLVNTFAYKYVQPAYVRYTDNVTPLESSPLVGYSHKFLTDSVITEIGPLNTGDYTLPISSNSWTLVANPYTATLDMNLNYIATFANWMPTGNIDPNIWVPTHGAAAGSPVQYATYNLSTGLAQNGGSKFVAPLQGFWIKNPKLTAGTYTVLKSSRVHDTSIKLKSLTASNDGDDVLRLTLSNNYAQDEVVLAFRNVGSTSVTYADSYKKSVSDTKVANFYSLKNASPLAINCLPVITEETIVPLGCAVGSAAGGNLTLKATNITGFLPSIDVILEDLSNGQLYNLREYSELTLALTAGTINGRFVLHLKPSESGVPTIDPNLPTVDLIKSITINSISNKVRVTIEESDSIDAVIDLFNQSGQWLSRINSRTKVTEFVLPDLKQVYIVRVVNGTSVKTAKVVNP